MLPVNGLYGHIQKNNLKSLLLLGVFFLLFELLAFLLYIPSLARQQSLVQEASTIGQSPGGGAGKAVPELSTLALLKANFAHVMADGAWITPLTGAFCWLFVAWLFLNHAVTQVTKAEPVERRDEPRLYNLVENLSILAGLPRPAIYVMETDALNAYASGLSPSTAMIAVSRGLLQRLNDRELEAVLAHEITHIKNRDTRLIAVASLFSGIVFRFAWVIVSMNLKPNPMMILTLPALTFFFWQALAIVLWSCFVIIFGGWLTRFAISRTRDYVADAGAIELTKDPDALASALRKIEGRETLKGVDVSVEAMLFASSTSGALSTHPSPRERIEALRETLPGMVSEKSALGLAYRDDGVTWEAIKAAANRTPKWVSHPYVLIPAVVLNFGVTYAVASVANPKLASDMRGFFSMPQDPPPPPREPPRTMPAACFPLNGRGPYQPGNPANFVLTPAAEKMYRAGDYHIWEQNDFVFPWRGKNIWEAAIKKCGPGTCVGPALADYKDGMSEYFRHRTHSIREFEADYGAPGLAFGQGYFDNARDRALLADLRTRIDRKEIDPAETPKIYDAIHLALEKSPREFLPCHSEEEWRKTAFPATPMKRAAHVTPSALRALMPGNK